MSKTRNARRILALTAGALLLLPGLGLMSGGGLLLWTHWFSRVDGFVVSPEERFGSDGYALVSDRVALDAAPDWLPLPAAALGDARIEVTGTGADDVFVGIAPAADAAGYLDGVRRTQVDGLGFDGPPAAGDRVPGDPPPGPPTGRAFWIAQATGPGTQQVVWDPDGDEWMFVIMNADGSAAVDVRARIGAELPALGGVGWTVLGAGTVLTLAAVLLLGIGIRRPSDRRPPASLGTAAAPSPSGRPAPPPRAPHPAVTGRGTGSVDAGRDRPGP